MKSCIGSTKNVMDIVSQATMLDADIKKGTDDRGRLETVQIFIKAKMIYAAIRGRSNWIVRYDPKYFG